MIKGIILSLLLLIEFNAIAEELTCYIDTFTRIDTLIYADDWYRKGYFKTQKKTGFKETKMFNFNENKIEIQQIYLDDLDQFKSLQIKINSKKYKLKSLHKQTYGISIDPHVYIMGNLVTAKYFENEIHIDIVLVQNNCLGDFCNDVEILTLKFSLDNKFLSLFLHDENLIDYSL